MSLINVTSAPSIIDATDAPGSPGWWLGRLMARLAAQAANAQLLDDYYRGEQAIPITSQNVREAYRRLMAVARTNFAELVVSAVRERMAPIGFRTGAVSDPTGDAEAWRIWQANSLDADCHLVHQAQLAMGAGYVIVGGIDPEIGAPLITPEDPRQVYAELDPVRRRRVRAAIKVWHDDVAEVDRAYLYLPGEVWTASRRASSAYDHPVLSVDAQVAPGGWTWDAGTPEALPAPVVPVVPFLNRPDLFSRPGGEFEAHVALLDRINYTLLSRLEIATLQAFRQRAIKGVPARDERGQEIDYSNVFASDPGALWLLPATADLWESGQVDLGPLRNALSDDVEHLAAVTRTPMHYFRPSEANQSAEGASAAREALVFKVRDRLAQGGESWEQVMSLVFIFAGDAERASRADMEVLWEDPQRYTLAERADAAGKALAAGVPWRTIMSDIWQFSPQQIDRMEAERTQDALLAALRAPLRPAPTAPGQGLPAAPETEVEAEG
jgi:hypothetical protein